MRKPPVHIREQRGVAMLTAILLVALGTILATAIAYQNSMTARRGAATFAYDQAQLVAAGAEALAAYALREDHKKASTRAVDHFGEDWTQPYGPIEVAPGVVLEAYVQDLQGRFNLNKLVKEGGVIDPVAVEAFEQLLETVGIEKEWGAQIADWIDADDQPHGTSGAEDSRYTGETPPYRTPAKAITSASELLALPQFGRERYLKLTPYVTALPWSAGINVCTAPGAVLDAWLKGDRQFSLDPQLDQKREKAGCFPRKDTEYQPAFTQLDPGAWQDVQGRTQEISSYFRLTSIVTIGTAQFALYSLLYRDGNGQVRPLLRTSTAD